MSRKLGQLGKDLRSLAKLPSDVTRDVAEDLNDLIESEFQKGVDPYGIRWKRLKNGKPSHLTETGALRRSLDVYPMSGAGVRIRISDLARHHQFGTKRMPARPVLPYKGLPKAWMQVIADAYDRAMKKRMKNR